MEKTIQISTPDKHVIFGTLNWKKAKPSKLVIFVHGLKSNQHRHLFFNGARYFTQRGFATFRFDLYSSNKKARTLTDCSLETHASDIDTVVKRFRKKYKEVHLVGHSLGGPSIIYSSQNVESIVLWDPSLVLKKSKQDFWKYDRKKKLYLVRGGIEFFVNKKMYNDWQASGKNMLAYMKVPALVICAGNGTLQKDWKKVASTIPVKHQLATIPGATHCFDEEGAEERLLAKTFKWLKQRSQA